MKTSNPILKQIKTLGDFFTRTVSAIVSGLPREKIYLIPENKAVVQTRKNGLKAYSEKHYHRPIAKPAVEKQTLLKENKKAKTTSKNVNH